MVLGLRTKSRKGTSVPVNYIIHIQEIKPWPPSQSLRSIRSVVLQWENGERNSGSLGPVVPSIGTVVGEGRIEFNESIKVSVTLSRELSAKGGDANSFQKNSLELNLYEPRRDKTVKGQLLGSVLIDLAEYGINKESTTLSIPINCKRSFRNTAQPVLCGKIQSFEKGSHGSSSRESPSKEESSLGNDAKESISALMNEEYAEEDAEIASFTDDDISSHSSLTMSSSAFEAAGSSPSQSDGMDATKLLEQNLSGGSESREAVNGVHELCSRQVATKEVVKSISAVADQNENSCRSSSIDLSSNSVVQQNFDASVSSLLETCSTKLDNKSDMVPYIHEKVVDSRNKIEENNRHHVTKESEDNGVKVKIEAADKDISVGKKKSYANNNNSHVLNGTEEAITSNVMPQVVAEESAGGLCGENGRCENKLVNNYPHDNSHEAPASEGHALVSWLGTPVTSGSDPLTFNRRSLGMKSNTLSSDILKNLNLTEVQEPDVEEDEPDVVEDAQNYSRSVLTDKAKDDRGSKSFGTAKVKRVPRETPNHFSDSKLRALQHRIELLEGELREAASLELSLYSIVAEHGSSSQKVHAPARRLSRLYLHASKKWSREKRGNAAKSVVSGLVLVAKACGCDVPRLTFWLSNAVVLRAIITQATWDSSVLVSAGSHLETNGIGRIIEKKSSPMQWREGGPAKKEKKLSFSQDVKDWEDPHTFTAALEKIEVWMFSRIIESVWWQTLTPHMQSVGGNQHSRKNNARKPTLGDQQHGNFSINLWKRAFKDACERICPVRAAGHDCGCLPMLPRLVMEQCIARLDVAMFNGILRESDDEIPTDPVSDPISNPKVLPIPAGITSFGSGAQLKNAIGTWSRWLTDLFGIDADDCLEDENEHDERVEPATAFKPFHLLNALSDLLMLPKDMLYERSILSEVCPIFGAPLIKRILATFVPDEFCPDPIPHSLLESLDSEDDLEPEEDAFSNFPCNASPIVYLPPSATSLAGIVGDIGRESLARSGFSVLRKGQTSDDELDELDSPLKSIIIDSRQSPTRGGWRAKETSSGNAVRFKLLREVWRDGQ